MSTYLTAGVGNTPRGMEPPPQPPPAPELPKWAEWLIRGTAAVLLVGCSGLLGWGLWLAVPKWWDARPDSAWGWLILVVPAAWGLYRACTKDLSKK